MAIRENEASGVEQPRWGHRRAHVRRGATQQIAIRKNEAISRWKFFLLVVIGLGCFLVSRRLFPLDGQVSTSD